MKGEQNVNLIWCIISSMIDPEKEVVFYFWCGKPRLNPFSGIHVFFYKHIKFSDEARLCISYHKIKAGVMLTVCLLQ